MLSCWACSGNDGVPDSLADDLHFDEIVMRCTHNSYHQHPGKTIDDSHNYEHLPLPQQFDAGVRAIELDIHSGTDYPVFHIPQLDPKSSCENLRVCLSQIASWSQANPKHHMMVVWIEAKDDLDWVGGDFDGAIDDYQDLDRVIREALTPERLYTPQDFARGYDSPRQALETDGWPTIGETRGRVMVVLLNVDAPHYQEYRDARPLAQRSMFSRARVEDYQEPWAVVAKENDPRAKEAIRQALDAHMLVASNTGGAGQTDAWNQERLDKGLENGTHMLCDDFPTARPEGGYWLDIPAFFPSGCNAITASPACENPHDESHDVSTPAP